MIGAMQVTSAKRSRSDHQLLERIFTWNELFYVMCGNCFNWTILCNAYVEKENKKIEKENEKKRSTGDNYS